MRPGARSQCTIISLLRRCAPAPAPRSRQGTPQRLRYRKAPRVPVRGRFAKTARFAASEKFLICVYLPPRPRTSLSTCGRSLCARTACTRHPAGRRHGPEEPRGPLRPPQGLRRALAAEPGSEVRGLLPREVARRRPDAPRVHRRVPGRRAENLRRRGPPRGRLQELLPEHPQPGRATGLAAPPLARRGPPTLAPAGLPSGQDISPHCAARCVRRISWQSRLHRSPRYIRQPRALLHLGPTAPAGRRGAGPPEGG